MTLMTFMMTCDVNGMYSYIKQIALFSHVGAMVDRYNPRCHRTARVSRVGNDTPRSADRTRARRVAIFCHVAV